MKRLTNIFVFFAFLILGTKAEATRIDRGNGLIDDTVLDITWTQTAGDGVPRDSADANTWAEDLVFGGFSDGRLPSMDVNGDGTGVTCCPGREGSAP